MNIVLLPLLWCSEKKDGRRIRSGGSRIKDDRVVGNINKIHCQVGTYLLTILKFKRGRDGDDDDDHPLVIQR